MCRQDDAGSSSPDVSTDILSPSPYRGLETEPLGVQKTGDPHP